MALKMGKNVFVLLFTILILFGGVCSVSVSSSPSRIVNGFFSNAFSMLMKWVLSLKATTKTAITGRSMMKFESGYNVETVFDGSKLGVEPYTVEVLSDGNLLILDSANSNLYKISSSLSLYSRPKLVSGSADGYSGHVDGKLREARMNHPKGLTVDDRGNIYIADMDNMAIRKISDTGVTTIAGGKKGRGGGHMDGPSEDAKFSNDFDAVYLGSSCSLLVIDRGNKAIREIQLNFGDCAYQYGSGFPLGFSLLIAAGCFGYLLALLQRRAGLVIPSDDEIMDESISPSPYQKPPKSFMRPPLIPNEDDQEKQEGFLASIAKLVVQTGESAAEILSRVFPVLKKKQLKLNHYITQNQYIRQQQPNYSNGWPVQESYVIRDDEAPAVETRTPTPRKTYAFMSKDSEKMQQLKKSRNFYSGLDVETEQKTKKQQNHHHHHHHQYHSSAPQTYYEQSSESTGEIVFGAVQEQEKKHGSVVIKPLDYGFGVYDRHSVRSRAGNAHVR